MTKVTENFRTAALRRGIVVKTRTPEAKAASEQVRFAAMVEMANLGFIVQPSELQGMSASGLTAMISSARNVMGADRSWTAIYPGFPKQVEDLSTVTLLVEQILHYWTAGALRPNYPEIAREGLALEDVRNARGVRVLPAGEAARELGRDLALDPIALSPDDKVLLEGCLELQHPTLADLSEVAKGAKNGENLQSYVRHAARVSGLSTESVILAVVPHVKNADSVLRTLLAVASSPSGEKWAENYRLASENLADRHARAVKMGRVSRPARRAVVEKLGVVSEGFRADSLVARRDLWRRVFRGLHAYDLNPTEEQKRVLDIVHSNVEYRTLNSLVEEAMAEGEVVRAVELMSEHQPGNLLRRAVALLRLVSSQKEARVLAEALGEVGSKSTLTTLISAYNGILSANDDAARVTRVAGLTNTMVDRKAVKKVNETQLQLVLDGVLSAIKTVLSQKEAPAGPVGTVGSQPVPLVRRDASTADRVLDRGQELAVAGEGDVLRIFGHWNNNQSSAGYMDIGVVVLDEGFTQIAVSTWNSWSSERAWSTYSGDCLVYPGNSAPEYIDVKLAELRKKYPTAKYAAMTVQSWSGWPIEDVDFIAGAMLRSQAEKGKTFDARSVATAFKPTTRSTQAVPFAVELESGKMIWLDSSNGSTASGVSSTYDSTIGSIVYDEMARPRLTMGELALLWAEAHGVGVTDEPVNRDQILSLLV